MGSQKGITLTSLVIYILIVIIVIGILATITVNFQSNIKEINEEGTNNYEIDKFNSYFLKEVKKQGNEIDSISDKEVIFTTGNKYTFKDDNIIYLNDNIKIAENIEKCSFESSLINGKTVITITIKAQNAEEKTIEYVLSNKSYTLSYEDEDNYNATGITKTWTQNEDGSITDGTVTLHIGDYINYDHTDGTENLSYTSYKEYNGCSDQTFSTSEYTEGWRLLGVDENGQLLLVSEGLVGNGDLEITCRSLSPTTLPTSTISSSTSMAGYVNAVEDLNNICALYGKGKYATGGRCITIEDINKITGYDPISSVSEDSRGGRRIWK